MSDESSTPQSEPLSTDSKAKEPIICCVIFSSPDYVGPATDHPMFLRGIYDFEKRLAEPIKSILLRSLEFMGYTLPSGFSIIACEVFYRDEHIEEVRCCGSHILRISANGEIEYGIWATPTSPQFTMTLRREIVLAPQDVGRTCVMVNQSTLILTAAWDLRALEHYTLRDDADFCALLVKELEDPPEDASEAEQIRAYLTETAKSLQGHPLELIREYVRSRPPADAGEHRSIVIRDKVGTHTYTYDVEQVEYTLKSGYADSIKLSQADVEANMREFSLSEDEAKALLMLEHLMARDEFVVKGLSSLEQKVQHLLEDTSSYLKQEINALALVEWSRSEGHSVKDTKAIKKAALDIATEMAKKRLELPGRGRPEGSKTTRDEEELHRLNRKHRAEIVRAIRRLFHKIYEATGNESAAEDAITKKAIAKEVPCSRTTLDEWLKLMQKGFNELKDETLESINVQRK
ncbi:MAG: hypothetical protein QOH25_3128 [Acidobacteriota bacterium]|jgi:hypothetical protein|nr:hypothetical protein [Acidobacteriota bacterium]